MGLEPLGDDAGTALALLNAMPGIFVELTLRRWRRMRGPRSVRVEEELVGRAGESSMNMRVEDDLASEADLLFGDGALKLEGGY